MFNNSLQAIDIDLSVQILCPYCKDVYNKPVTLPCGKNICKCHITEILSNQSKSFLFDQNKLFKCMLCKNYHETCSISSFPLNTKIIDLVKKFQVRATPIKEIHRTANESYNKLTEMIEEFTNINEESETFIYNYFSEIERKVDLKRELLIENIHNISENLMGKIAAQKKEIRSKQQDRKKKQAYDKDQLENYKIELDNYNKELKEYSIDLNKWKVIQAETETKREDLKIKIDNLQEEIMCHKSISFKEGNMKIDSKELFGEIFVKDTHLSKSIDPELLAVYDEAKKLCESNFEIYKLQSYSFNFSNKCTQRASFVRNYMINKLKISEKLADLLIKNSTEENWPAGFKTQELRGTNENMFKKLKVDYAGKRGNYAVIVFEANNSHLRGDFNVPGGYILWFNNPNFEQSF